MLVERGRIKVVFLFLNMEIFRRVNKMCLVAHFWKIDSKKSKELVIKNVDYSLSCKQFKFE